MVRLLRRPIVLDRSGQSKTTLYANIGNGLMPSPVKLGARSVGWVESEIDAVLAARIAGQSDTEIRALIVKLEAARRQGS
ncbi:AlpA family phage regulatory protein [Burkholderia arboris]|uniref:helix-turn-helix transcriptional regulator n=1 Tax=Burkholderia arboris TaxID=488730 RepID=UPI001CA3FF63|nr:AlpA family phage regulatory protein [Burkholderia arboris]MBY8605242.1 AlpA family phage regulatory protein [Burkholderia arboris]